MLNGPIIRFAYGMTFYELLGVASEARSMYSAVVNEKERKNEYCTSHRL